MDLQGFFPSREFSVYRYYLNDSKKAGLAWPDYVQLSSDHTHPRWRFTSHRRLKNVIVVLDWVRSHTRAHTLAHTPSPTPTNT